MRRGWRCRPPAPSRWLERVAQAELHSARTEEGRGNSPKRGAVNGKGCRARTFAAHVERRVIEQVEPFRPQLHLVTLLEPERLTSRHIVPSVPGARELAALQRPERSRRGIEECLSA